MERPYEELATPVGGPIIEWGCELLRSAPTLPAERLWHLAAISLIEVAHDHYFLTGFVNPQVAPMNAARIRSAHGRARNHLSHARERFPDEPGFRLAEVISTEVRQTGGWCCWLSRPSVSPPEVSVASLRKTIGAYLDLATVPALRAEALLRAGVLAFRFGEDADALKRLAEAEASTDEPAMLYLTRFVRGKISERAGRTADAEAAYRSALELIPHAQSATMGLAALLFLGDGRAEAQMLVTRMLEAAPQPIDPWREYGCGGCRHWPARIRSLRQELARLR
jgi:hypothetical protein